jgi:hypothetical protein
MKRMIVISGFLVFICLLMGVVIDCVIMQYVVLPAMESLATGGITSVKTQLAEGLSTPFSPLIEDQTPCLQYCMGLTSIVLFNRFHNEYHCHSHFVPLLDPIMDGRVKWDVAVWAKGGTQGGVGTGKSHQ